MGGAGEPVKETKKVWPEREEERGDLGGVLSWLGIVGVVERTDKDV